MDSEKPNLPKARFSSSDYDAAEAHLKKYVRQYIKQNKGKDFFFSETQTNSKDPTIKGVNSSLLKALKSYPATKGAKKHMEVFLQESMYKNQSGFVDSMEKAFMTDYNQRRYSLLQKRKRGN